MVRAEARSGAMDPAVIAAIVSSPTALVAAGAAYAAGRIQARGAHRGPVDAIRRQHQREAYAALIAEGQKYANHAFGRSATLARPDGPLQRGSLTVEDAQPLVYATAAVRLEGPAHLAEQAKGIQESANLIFGLLMMLEDAREDARAPGLPSAREAFDEAYEEFRLALGSFVHAASLHLNGEEPGHV